MGSVGEPVVDESLSNGRAEGAMAPAYNTSISGTNGTNGMRVTNEINGVNNVNDNNGAVKTSSTPEAIAIVGMAMRLPGGIHSEQQFWDLLINKQTTRGSIPASRYNLGGFYTSTNRPASTGTQHGHYLSDIDGFDKLDTSFFNFSKAEAEKLDPQQRMLLEVVWECIENAGQTGWRGSNIGVFVGAWGNDWADLLEKDPQQVGGMLNVLGGGHYAVANRVAYEFDLHGPTFAINTACSSSMVCLHQAVQALRNDECDAAIVAGTNLILTPTQTMTMTEGGILSPTGECRTFDATANGYSRGEAVNALLLKKFSVANSDDDNIRAIIRATAVNCDGTSAGFSTPSPKAQSALMRQAYRVARLADPSETPFVEVHGTGTTTGDPLELEAVAEVFGTTNDTYVGGVKANVGHGESASGVTSVIKSVLMLEKRMIPPQANFTTPNPRIPFQEARLIVPLTPTEWPQGRPERISVNSLGITGTNAHAVIESASSYQPKVQRKVLQSHSEEHPPRIMLLSATNQQSLKQRGETLSGYIKQRPDRLADLAYTLACRRDHLSHRAYCITNGVDLMEMITSDRAKSTPKIAFIFTGQGAQWAGMGRDLIAGFPSFHAVLTHLNGVLKSLPHPPSWDLVDEILHEGPKSRVNKAEFSQPLCTALQVALVDLLKAFGVEPAAVVGHSSGEIGAAYAAGALSAAEAVTAAYYRGLTSTSGGRQGAMAAVGISRAEATLYLEDGAVVACDNSPQSATLSGDEDAIDRMIESIKSDDPDMFARRLKTDGMAYHSHHMAEIGPIYERYLEGLVTGKPPKTAFFSTVTGKLLTSEDLGPRYWRRNLESQVRFFPAIRTLIDAAGSDQLFVEIGPHSALAGPLRQIFKNSSSKARLSYCSSLVRGKDGIESILDMCGQLYLQNIPLQLESLTPAAELLHDLPNYPWRHDTSHWAETRPVREWRHRKHAPHELLGSRILEGSDVEPTWRNVLRLKDALWLQDHRLYNDVVVPCAAYIAMAGEASMQLGGTTGYNIRDMNVNAALVVQDKPVEIMTSLRRSKQNPAWFEFAIYSHNGSVWTEHTDGLVQATSDDLAPVLDPTEPETLPRRVKSPYDMFESVGLYYGPHFQGLDGVSVIPGQRTASSRLTCPSTASGYPLHPGTIDQCLQLTGIAACEGLTRKLNFIPIPRRIAHIEVRALTQAASLTAKANVSEVSSKGNIRGDAFVAAGSQTFFSIRDCQLDAFEDRSEAVVDDTIAATRLSWRPHLDFVPLESLMVQYDKDPSEGVLIEAYGLLCCAEIRERIKDVPDSAEHFTKFRKWIVGHVEKGLQGQNRVVRNSQELLQYSAADRRAKIDELRASLKTTMFVHVAELITRLLDHCEGIFDGSAEALEIFTEDESLTLLYSITGDRIDSTEFFVTIGHTNPTLRVLEIGTGTGGTAMVALRALTSVGKEPMYSRYTVTDISSGFFNAAKERLHDFPALEFKTLDISRDPVEQGFELGVYDLIIASNVIHATDVLSDTLTNVHRLLSPKGRFFLQELKPSPPKMLNIIMGPLPGWWLGEADGRPTEPLVSPERWEEELRGAGFSGIECIVHDDIDPDQSFGMNIIARPAVAAPHYPSVTLLVKPGQADDGICASLQEVLKSRDYFVDICVIGQPLPPHQDIISLVEVSDPFFGHLTQQDLQNVQDVLSEMTSGRMLWVMGSGQLAPIDPLFALTLGATRCIRAHMSTPIATLEIDSQDNKISEMVFKVFESFLSQASLSTPEQEYCIKDGIVHVGRFHWTRVSDELAQSQNITDCALKLVFGTEGSAATARWFPQPKPVLGEDDVLVRSIFVGTMSNPTVEDQSICDYSGQVLATGSSVESLQVGDLVVALDVAGVQTHYVISAERVLKLPKGLTSADASMMPVAFITSIYCLMHVAHLRQDQVILITDGISTIGQAAIQICKKLDAQVLCCVKTEEERAKLPTLADVAPEHIVLRSSSAEISRLQARRIDVILNNSGALSHDVAGYLAAGGKFINIAGVSTGALDTSLLKGNKAIFNIDMAEALESHPELLPQLNSMLADGTVKQLALTQPVHAFELEQHLQGITKINDCALKVQLPEDISQLPLHQGVPSLKFKESGAYLMVGGLGGLGHSVSTWMAEQGTRHFVFLSRSAGSSSHTNFFKELEVQGCTVQALACDISCMEQVRSALSQVSQPIAGVIHMGMVLSDAPFLSMTFDNWVAATNPKVIGTMNLHKGLLERSSDSPDFFIMFSSISGALGMAHQANYGAGNTFQKAFVQYRQSLGLPASVLDIGAMSDVGYVSHTPEAQAFFKGAGMPFMNESELFESLHLSILQQHPDTSPAPSRPAFTGVGRGWEFYGSDPGITSRSQLTLGIRATKPMTDSGNRVLWRRDRRADIYRNIEAARLAAQGGAGNARGAEGDGATHRPDRVAALMGEVRASTEPAAFLASTSTQRTLTREVGRFIYECMLKTVRNDDDAGDEPREGSAEERNEEGEEMELQRALMTLGVDSLVTIEVRSWLRRQLGVEVSTLEMLNGGTIEGLGALVVERLKVKFVAIG